MRTVESFAKYFILIQNSYKFYLKLIQNVLIQVQLELLKRDLADKEDLLVQTAKALELLKQGHKANIDELIKTHNTEKEELQNRVDRLDKVLCTDNLTMCCCVMIFDYFC